MKKLVSNYRAFLSISVRPKRHYRINPGKKKPKMPINSFKKKKSIECSENVSTQQIEMPDIDKYL